MAQIDFNNTRCIVEKGHFGYDTFVNICTGHNVDAPWTIADWANFGGLVFAILLVLGMLGGFGWIVWQESRDWR